jgi:predicted homoserine dehydrogenase-like protein
MNYELLFKDLKASHIRIALTGANGGFGRTLLVQARAVPNVEIAALCDIDIDGMRAALTALGYSAKGVRVCLSAEDVRRASAEASIVLVKDHALLGGVSHDILVEATGQPETSVQIAIDAIARGVHVAMVTKETDSVVGPYLNRLAHSRGVVYTTVDGDQPSNLIGLVTWARTLGFEIVAAGKSSEYDYVFRFETDALEYPERKASVPELARLWSLADDVPATLAQRSAAINAFPQSATPDYCEMNIVANSTGLLPACDTLSYPLCRIPELADIFIPKEDGGILARAGVVDVFNCLRRHDEASFAGGVFVVVKCTDDAVWRMLQEKGHVVSRRRKYACIYRPYHLMGLESLVSVFSAVLHQRPSGSLTQQMHAVMLARTQREFRAGETLQMSGHHHAIDGVAALLVPAHEAGGKAPFYLAAGKRLRADVPRNADITFDILDLEGSALYAAWQDMSC